MSVIILIFYYYKQDQLFSILLSCNYGGLGGVYPTKFFSILSQMPSDNNEKSDVIWVRMAG